MSELSHWILKDFYTRDISSLQDGITSKIILAKVMSVDISGTPAVETFFCGWLKGRIPKAVGSHPLIISGLHPNHGLDWWKVHNRNLASACWQPDLHRSDVHSFLKFFFSSYYKNTSLPLVNFYKVQKKNLIHNHTMQILTRFHFNVSLFSVLFQHFQNINLKITS